MSHPVIFLCTGNAARSVMGGAALHMGNIAASGVTLSDAVLKIGKRL